jgi:hypothetical protein
MVLPLTFIVMWLIAKERSEVRRCAMQTMQWRDGSGMPLRHGALSREADGRVQDGPPLHGIRRKNPSGPLLAGKQHKAAVLARKVAKGPRKKRTRPKPRQYTVADLERARDRVAAAERRIDNERLNIPHRGRAGLERAQRELSVIEAQLRLRGLLE